VAGPAFGAARAVAAAPAIQSHRGGPVRDGKPVFAEESMAGFRSAFETEQTTLELDVKLSKDRVPVVIHDDTLDRTTACTGRVDSKTWAELSAQCPSDVLGIDGYVTAPALNPVPMARLRDVLDYAKASGATLNLEIKNIPGEDDFDPSPAYATTVIDEIKASGLPLKQLIVQSFYPPNLDEVQSQLPGAETAFLTSTGTNSGGAEYAAARGYTWWSPGWPVTKAEVDKAHSLGLKVVPWTLDKAADVKEAATAGVEALITNDPVMAKKALGLPVGVPPAPQPAAPADRARARMLTSRARVRKGAFTLRLRTTGPLNQAVTARSGRARIARGSLSAGRSGTFAVRMQLSRTGSRLLASRGRLVVTVLGRRVRLTRANA
jgi:glycerophosphoryl diester phosphodiesterase